MTTIFILFSTEVTVKKFCSCDLNEWHLFISPAGYYGGHLVCNNSTYILWRGKESNCRKDLNKFCKINVKKIFTHKLIWTCKACSRFVSMLVTLYMADDEELNPVPFYREQSWLVMMLKGWIFLIFVGNFPPTINNITETSDTNALTGTDTVCVVVGETYMFLINATDQNEGDEVLLSLNGTVPEGASINQSTCSSFLLISF